MANNFRLIGDIYVSKAGDDTYGDGTAETPYKTMQKGIDELTSGAGTAQTIIVGAGVYSETLTFSTDNVVLTAEGVVVFDGAGTLNITFPANRYITFNGFIIRNYLLIDNLLWQSYITFNNSTIRDNTTLTCADNFSVTLYRTNIINNDLIPSGGTPGDIDFYLTVCIIINSDLSQVDKIKSSYANSSCNIEYDGTAANFLNNNIEGVIIIGGINYSVCNDEDNVALTPIVGTTSLATLGGWSALYTSYRNFRADALFNEVSKSDFSLQVESPHIRRGVNGVNIGGTKYARSIFAGTDTEIDTATKTNITGTTDLISPDTGIIITKAIEIPGDVAKTLDVINYIGNLAFDSDETGAPKNINVPDTTPDDGGAWENPNHLTYQMRWSTSISIPIISTDWDNGLLVNAGTYSTFKWNTKPQIDNTIPARLGNGMIDFNASGASDISAKWVQFTIVLTDSYVS